MYITQNFRGKWGFVICRMMSLGMHGMGDSKIVRYLTISRLTYID